MPICPPPTKAGFTLIELLVVMTILGLVASYAVGGFAKGRNRFDQERSALKLQTAIGKAAAEARLSGKKIRLHPSAALPGASLGAASFPQADRKDVIILYPDGSTSGGIINVDGEALVTLDWLTGRIARAQ